MEKPKTRKYIFLAPAAQSYAPVRLLIDEALREQGLEPLAEEFAPGLKVSDAVLLAIEQADVVVADLTETDPNVMYQVGYAHAGRKPVLLLTQQRTGRLAADVGGNLFFVYDPAQPASLRENIKRWLRFYPLAA